MQPAKKRQKTASLSQQSVANPSSAEQSPPEPLSDQNHTESPSVCYVETPGPRSTETIHDDSFPSFSSIAISPGSPSPEQVNPTVTTNFTTTTQATAVCNSTWVTSTPVSGCTKCVEKSRTNRSLKKSNRRLRRKVNELKQDIKLLKTVSWYIRIFRNFFSPCFPIWVYWVLLCTVITRWLELLKFKSFCLQC